MRLMLGTRKGLFIWARHQDGWRIDKTAFLGNPVVALLQEPTSRALYAALDHGHFGNKLHRSNDDGDTWQEIGVPTYPPRPADAKDKDPIRNTPLPWSLKLIWCLESGLAADGGSLWCGTIPGGLFHSRDAGDSWELVQSLWDHPARQEWVGGGADLPGIHSVLVDPRDPACVTLGVSCGGVWQTRDAGRQWQSRTQGMWAAYMPPERKYDPNIQDPHRLASARANPEVIWAQHHNGVFRSSDYAATWQEIEHIQPSGFGFAVAVHPEDADTAWLIPAIKDESRYPVDAQLVVLRSRDGGQSFQPLRAGLPQQHAYDLVYRHALDIDQHGDTLAFGSTTGNLWISEDQGDHWQQPSGYLPPIYCLRWMS